MQTEKSFPHKTAEKDQSAGEAALQPRGKGRWHAPVFKRLDVDLTATQVRTSNEGPTGETHFSS